MKILLDATGWHSNESGMSRYIISMIDTLPKLFPENDYTVIVNPNFDQKDTLPDNTDIYPHRVPHIGLKREIAYFRLKKDIDRRFDIYHCLTEKWPTAMKSGVCTIHDLRQTRKNVFRGAGWLKSAYFNHMIRRAARTADQIIAVSGNTKQELLSLVGESFEDKISVVHHGIPSRSVAATSWDELSRKHAIQKPYFLVVGEVRRHKNLEGVVKAFSLFRSRHDANEAGLVIVGRIVENDLYAAIKNTGIENIVFTDYISSEDLSACYDHSQAVVMVSIVEGFGFPVIEAMARGIPVICSDSTSLVEIAGGAALTVDPRDHNGIADRMQSVLSDNELRSKLVAAGLSNVNRFSWESAANKTMNVYRKVRGDQSEGLGHHPHI